MWHNHKGLPEKERGGLFSLYSGLVSHPIWVHERGGWGCCEASILPSDGFGCTGRTGSFRKGCFSNAASASPRLLLGMLCCEVVFCAKSLKGGGGGSDPSGVFWQHPPHFDFMQQSQIGPAVFMCAGPCESLSPILGNGTAQGKMRDS